MSGEELLGEGLGERGGYGSGFVRKFRGVMMAAAGGAILKVHTPLRAMSEEQLKAFLEAVKADVGLQEQLKAAGDADADAVLAIAKAAGFVISTEELAGGWGQRAQAEISEDELEGVAGGSVITKHTCKNLGQCWN